MKDCKKLLNEKFNNKAPFSISDFSPWIAIQPKTENGNIVLETTGLFSSDQLTKMSLLANQTNRLSKFSLVFRFLWLVLKFIALIMSLLIAIVIVTMRNKTSPIILLTVY